MRSYLAYFGVIMPYCFNIFHRVRGLGRRFAAVCGVMQFSDTVLRRPGSVLQPGQPAIATHSKAPSVNQSTETLLSTANLPNVYTTIIILKIPILLHKITT